jgi:hypothetical protein
MPSASIGDIHIGQNGAWKVPGARWPAIVLAIVVLDVAHRCSSGKQSALNVEPW